MKLKFSPEFLSEVKSLNNILDVAADYFIIQQTGGIYRAHCKHGGGDKTPSLTFFDDTQSFYCFSCHAGGKNHKETNGSDVIDFVQWMEGCTWQEAVVLLANKAGLEIPQAQLSKEEKEKLALYDVVLNENRGYYNSLMQDKKSMDYFNNRGIDIQDMTKWRLGSKNGNPVYSILDDNGKTVSFSTRYNNPGGKYVNGEASSIFKKGNILYGLNFIKRELRQLGYMVLVEGYNDAIILQKYGVPAVALMGTALTKGHIALIKKYVEHVILFLDGDQPGIEAATSHIYSLSKECIATDILTVLDKDPDDLALELKDSTLDYILSNKEPGFQFIVNKELSKYMSKSTELKLSTLKKIDLVLNKISDNDEKDIYKEQVRRLIILEEGGSNGIQQDNTNNDDDRENA